LIKKAHDNESAERLHAEYQEIEYPDIGLSDLAGSQSYCSFTEQNLYL